MSEFHGQKVSVSLICPVYKAEKTLNRCLDSVIAQTYHDWELVVVIDGSPDASLEIAETYAAQDSRIRIISQKNQGVSAARQTGLNASQGEYIIHIDPDDWCDPTMLQSLCAKVEKERVDVVICDYFVTDTEGHESLCTQRPSSLHPHAVLREMFTYLHGSCCNKLVKRECLTRYGVRFIPGVNYGEDMLFWAQLLQHDALRIACVPHAYYHYVQHGSSITQAYTRETYDKRLLYLRELEECLPPDGYAYEKRRAALCVFMEAYTHGVFTIKEAWHQLWLHRRAAFCEPLTWREWTSSICILLGILPLIRRLRRAYSAHKNNVYPIESAH